jgi:hypothetical protein
MRQALWLTLVVGAAAVGTLYAGAHLLARHTVWVVPWDCKEIIRVEPGDVIEVWTRPLAVIPENLEARFRASKVGRNVELVGETLPHREGTMERLYFFRAFEPGPATLKVELLDRSGEVRETFTYAVEVQPAAGTNASGN